MASYPHLHPLPALQVMSSESKSESVTRESSNINRKVPGQAVIKVMHYVLIHERSYTCRLM